MNIKVRYFASLREALGAEEQVVLPGGGTVGALRDHLLGLWPAAVLCAVR
jgi:molybdopterin synthase sulfur carrier subunit